MNKKKGLKKGIALFCSFVLALQLAACGDKEGPAARDIGTEEPVAKAIWTGDPNVKPPTPQSGSGQSYQPENHNSNSLNGMIHR